MSRSYHASCAIGLEHVLAAELTTLGAAHVNPHPGGATFKGDREVGYRAVLWLRSASRVTERLMGDRPAATRELLYDAVRGFDWRGLLSPRHTFAVHATVRDSRQADARFVALVVKDAIADALRDTHGARPDVNPDDPDVPLRVVVRRNRAELHRDLSGESLHRRGWRPVQVKSPLNEAIAAGLLLHTGWTAEQPLLDPMCGSGTFLIEAAHQATDRAPGLDRVPVLTRFPDADRPAWDRLLEEARQRHAVGRATVTVLHGADAHPGAVALARHSATLAGVADRVRLRECAVADLQPEVPPALVLSNPPWGERLTEHTEAWRDLGAFLKHRAHGATAWLLSGAPELTAAMHLKASARLPVRVGPIDARWLRYVCF